MVFPAVSMFCDFCESPVAHPFRVNSPLPDPLFCPSYYILSLTLFSYRLIYFSVDKSIAEDTSQVIIRSFLVAAISALVSIAYATTGLYIFLVYSYFASYVHMLVNRNDVSQVSRYHCCSVGVCFDFLSMVSVTRNEEPI